MSTPFAEATAVTAVGPGRYTATVDPSWNLRPLPQGGIVTALALRAMAAELDDPAQRLRTLHTVFVAQVGRPKAVIAEELAGLLGYPPRLRVHRPRASGRGRSPRCLPFLSRSTAAWRRAVPAYPVLGPAGRRSGRPRPRALGGLRPRSSGAWDLVPAG